MSDDTISRQAAIEKVETAAEFWSNADDFAEGVHAGYLLAANLIKALPSAERRGRWIDHSDEWDGGYYECSVCGEPWVFIDGTPKDNNANYCPNCGAKMDGDTE